MTAKTDQRQGLLCHCPTAGPVAEGHPLGTPGCESKIPAGNYGTGWTDPQDWSPTATYATLAELATCPQEKAQFLRQVQVNRAADLEWAAQTRTAHALNRMDSANEAIRAAHTPGQVNTATERVRKAMLAWAPARRAALELRAKNVFG